MNPDESDALGYPINVQESSSLPGSLNPSQLPMPLSSSLGIPHHPFPTAHMPALPSALHVDSVIPSVDIGQTPLSGKKRTRKATEPKSADQKRSRRKKSDVGAPVVDSSTAAIMAMMNSQEGEGGENKDDEEGGSDDDDDSRRQKRLEKNREAAQQFRQRQKAHIVSLEQRVAALGTENTDYKAKVELLKSENKLIKDQLNYLRSFISQAISFSLPFTGHPTGAAPSTANDILASVAESSTGSDTVQPASGVTVATLQQHPHQNLQHALQHQAQLQQLQQAQQALTVASSTAQSPKSPQKSA